MPEEADTKSSGRDETNLRFLQQIMGKAIADPKVIEIFPMEARELLMDWAANKNEATLTEALEWEASNED